MQAVQLFVNLHRFHNFIEITDISENDNKYRKKMISKVSSILKIPDKIISINKQPADHMQNHQVLKSRDQQFEANASRMFSLF